MSVISMEDYLKIADNYGLARNQVLSSVQYLFDAVYDVVMLQGIIPEVDLLSEFYNSYQINTNTFRSPITMLSAVRTLNNHVINRGGWTSIEEFLLKNGDPLSVNTNVLTASKVNAGWAELSNASGYTIGVDYIA